MDPQDPKADGRLDAFCSRLVPELFHGVAHTHDVWRHDPFDVQAIHLHARRIFERQVERVLPHVSPEGAVQGATGGRLILLQGEPGAGKTHLMRAFRNQVHADRTAFFAYMQMTSSSREYDRYVLQKLVDSFEQPHHAPAQPTSSLKLLAEGLADLLPAGHVRIAQELHDAGDPSSAVKVIADQVVDALNAPDIDPDLCRVLLMMLIDRPSITRRAVKFLRCEPLSDHDRMVLGDVAPRLDGEAPIERIGQFRALIQRVMGSALVVCADQLEDIYNLEESGDRFAHAVTVLKTIAEMPGTVVVVSCLEEFYLQLKVNLSRSLVDRLEMDPDPVVLKGDRNADEVRQIVQRRLEHLYEVAEAPVDAHDPTFPFMPAQLHLYAGQTTRQVLGECLRFREAAIELQRLPILGEVLERHEGLLSQELSPPPEVVHDLQQEWNDFKVRTHRVPDEEQDLLALLQEAVGESARELGASVSFAMEPDGDERFVVRPQGFEDHPSAMVVALCDRDPRGGALASQIQRALESAGDKVCVLVRSAAFIRQPGRVAAQRVAEVVARGGRTVVVEDSDWRHMVALQAFREVHGNGDRYRGFVEAEKPLSGLASLRSILGLSDLRLPADDAPPLPPDTEEVPLPKAKPAVQRAPVQGPLVLGQPLEGDPGEAVELDPTLTAKHMVFLGGSGSGKTTTALMLIEQLLARGVPTVLVDRNGGLCGYADPATWRLPSDDPATEELRRTLADHVDVALFTPGKPEGRSLELPAAPPGLGGYPEDAREITTRIASNALAEAMTSSRGVMAQRKRAALQLAMSELAASRPNDRLYGVRPHHLPERQAAPAAGQARRFGPVSRRRGGRSAGVDDHEGVVAVVGQRSARCRPVAG